MTVPDFFADITEEKPPEELKVPEAIPDFFREAEEVEIPTVEKRKFFERLGETAAIQAQIMPPAEALEQLVSGAAEELSLGAIDVMKPKTPAGKLYREAGSFAIGFPVLMTGLGRLLKPVGWLGRLLGTATAGGTRSAVKQYFKKGEINPKEVGKQTAIWGAIEGGIQLFGLGLTTKRAVDFISKTTGKPKGEVARFLADKFKNRFKRRFKAEPTPSNVAKMPPALINETVEGAVGDLQKEAARLKEIPIKPPIPIKKPPIIEAPKVPEIPIEIKKPPSVDPGIPQKITESTAKYFSKLGAKLDVEYPFKKIKAPETGFTVKNYYDRINFHIEKGKQEIKKIKKLDLTSDQLSDVVLTAEKEAIPKDPKIKEGRKILRKYFDNSLRELKKEGILKKGYHERLVDDLQNKIKANDEIAKISSTRQKRKIIKENNEIKRQLNEVKKLRFVSIPVRELFETETMGDPNLTKRVIKYLTKKRRKTLTMEDLVDSGAIEKKDLTPDKIINSYSKKFGRDMALAKIINAGKEEGLVSSKEIEGMVKIPGYIAPELTKYYVSPTFADFIQGYTNPRTYTNWEKLANRLKGWSFYNPLVLGFNNLWQHSWAILGQPQHLLKLPRAWRQAVIDVRDKTPNYWEAFENGIRSSPFVALEKNIRSLTESVKKEGPNPLLSMIKISTKHPIAIHEKLYDAMQTLAWTGFDMIPRMATYNWLRSIGLNPRDAAQTAALFHGDYASVPADIRRKLNKFVYTPTFPIVMTKAVLENLKNSGKVAKISYERAKGEKKEKIDPKTKARASGLIGATIILGAAHLTMKSLGFYTVFPIWHYKRDFRDKKGKLKTQHIYLSFPFTTLWKYMGRGYAVFTEPGIENRMLRFAKRMKFQLAIPIQILWELMENKNRHWKQIYDSRSPIYEQAIDMLTYIGKRALPFIGIPLGETFREPKQRQQLVDEMGRLITMIPSVFTFISDTDRKRARKKANTLKRRMQWLKKQKKLTPKEIENYKKEIKKLREIK